MLEEKLCGEVASAAATVAVASSAAFAADIMPNVETNKLASSTDLVFVFIKNPLVK
jgi:hypothetical protein